MTNITIKCKVIFPDSEIREVDIGAEFGYSYGYHTKEVRYTPQYKKKNIMGWVEIENSSEVGFNLWLVQTEGIYGDWYILRNKNNLIYWTDREPLKEPFAFAIEDLNEAIKGVEASSLYTSSVEPFTEEFISACIPCFPVYTHMLERGWM